MRQTTLFGMAESPDAHRIMREIVMGLDSDKYSRSQVIKMGDRQGVSPADAAKILDGWKAAGKLYYIGSRKLVRPWERRKIQ